MLVSPKVGALQTNGFRIAALLLRMSEVPRTHIYKISPLKSDSCCDHHSKLAYTIELTQDRSTLGVSKPGKCSPNLFLMICSYLQAATPLLYLCYTPPYLSSTFPIPLLHLAYTSARPLPCLHYTSIKTLFTRYNPSGWKM